MVACSPSMYKVLSAPQQTKPSPTDGRASTNVIYPSGGWRATIKVLVWLSFDEGPLSGQQMAIFLLCLGGAGEGKTGVGRERQR